MQVIISLAIVLCIVSVKLAEPVPRNVDANEEFMMRALQDGLSQRGDERRYSSQEIQAADETAPPLYRPLCETKNKVVATYEAFKLPKYEFVPETFKSSWCVTDNGKHRSCGRGYGHCMTQYENREFVRRLKGSTSCQPWEKVQRKVKSGCNCLTQI